MLLHRTNARARKTLRAAGTIFGIRLSAKGDPVHPWPVAPAQPILSKVEAIPAIML
jgi:hypothetical protein